jgi:hypothetical protein
MTKKQIILIVLVVGLLLWVDPMYAGPGGYIAKGLFKSWWGKLLLAALTIIFLPLILYVRIVEYRKARKIKKVLNQLAVKNKALSWMQLEKEFSNIIRRVYNAWTNEDMAEVKSYVNHWYWQNQQLVYLEQWKRENLKNVSRLRTLNKMRPVYMELSQVENWEGSRIAVAVDLEVEDYLMERDTKQIIQGKVGYQDVEYVWFFEYTGGQWLLDDIQEGSLSFQFAKMKDVVPEDLNVIVR